MKMSRASTIRLSAILALVLICSFARLHAAGVTPVSAQAPATATRWIGGFNPLAVYDVAISEIHGSGQIGRAFAEAMVEMEKK